jgi:hypothetical protein
MAKSPVPVGTAVIVKLKLETVPPTATVSLQAVVLALGVQAPAAAAYQDMLVAGGRTC